MPDAHPALETSNGRRVKHVSDHPIGFHLVESTSLSTGHDARRILTSASRGQSKGVGRL